MKKARPTAAEKAMLALVLQEVRRLRKKKLSTIMFLVDPWVGSDGFYVFVQESNAGHEWECAGNDRPRPRR